MPAKRRTEYDSSEFAEMWHDTRIPISAIAEKYGVAVSSVWLAGTRRFLPRYNIRNGDQK